MKRFDVLQRMMAGATLGEFVVPLTPFRGLGDEIPAQLQYWLETDRVPYKTFLWLFKTNKITPLSKRPTSAGLFVVSDLGKIWVRQCISKEMARRRRKMKMGAK